MGGVMFKVGIIGLGWSGSGALVDLLKKQTSSSAYPIELDFFRKPNGLMGRHTGLEFIKYTIVQFKINLIKFIFSTGKMLLNIRQCKVHFQEMFLSLMDLIILVISFLFFILMLGYKDGAKIYLSLFDLVYGKGSEVMIYDQPYFVDQLEFSGLDLLGVNANIIVIRNIYDQVQDLYLNREYLTSKTIREGFLLGFIGNSESFLSSNLLRIILMTTASRIKYLIDFIEKNPKKFLVVEFEELLFNKKNTAIRINNYCKSQGLKKNLIIEGNIKNFFQNSKKNVGIKENLGDLDLDIERSLVSIDSDLKILARLTK
jgi:hypothetical protein